VSLVSIEIPLQLAGRMVKDVTVSNEIAIIAITRQGAAFIPSLGSQFKEGDLVHAVVLASSLERFKTLLGLLEGG
jgi:Trk K+ transport system NAD-binding subunit